MAPQPESWGTSTDILKVYGSGDFVAPANTVAWSTIPSATTGIGVAQTSAALIDWYVQIHIPGGATLLRVDIEACDTSATSGLAFGIVRGATPGGTAANISGLLSTGVAATPGCAFFPIAPAATTVINNATSNYWLFFYWNGAGGTPNVQIHSARVVYRLAVAPAPATATFTDVPVGHPQHRFIEALAATGITGGCGAGVFCPDAPLTRGQMAVFLAVAFGLHSAP